MPSTDQLVPGALFANQFELQAPLGSGLTSHVWRAVRRSDQRVVALKVMRPGLSENLRAGFAAEGKTLRQLWLAENERGDGWHGVPEWFGQDTHAGVSWLALELLERITIEQPE